MTNYILCSIMFEFGLLSKSTLPFSSRIKTHKNFLICAFSVFYGTVYLRVRHVGGDDSQRARTVSRHWCFCRAALGEFLLSLSLNNLGLPRSNVLFLKVVLSKVSVFSVFPAPLVVFLARCLILSPLSVFVLMVIS